MEGLSLQCIYRHNDEAAASNYVCEKWLSWKCLEVGGSLRHPGKMERGMLSVAEVDSWRLPTGPPKDQGLERVWPCQCGAPGQELTRGTLPFK